MFCFVQTDAGSIPRPLELLTGVCVKRSFDRIRVDGQLSTSDTVVVRQRGVWRPDRAGDPDEIAFGEALDALMRQLALEIVRDGEGAERVGRVVVRARRRSSSRWPLGCELAAREDRDHGGRPQLRARPPGAGQVASGRGVHRRPRDRGPPARLGGDAVDIDAEALATSSGRLQPEVEIVLTVPGEGGETEVFFSDLSEGYVRLNASYTS